MNVNCNLTTCSFILNSKCVFYESFALPYTGIATNDSVEVALQKIEEIIATIISEEGGGIVQSITPGIGISVTGTSEIPIITNTLPDQTVVLNNGTGISVTGTYPNFTITNTSPSSGGTVTSVSGTTDRITSTGGNTPVIDIASTYVGQTSITTLGTINTGIWQGSLIELAYGGTGASLTDPGADRIMFFDDDAGTVTWLLPNNGLIISGTNLNLGGTLFSNTTINGNSSILSLGSAGDRLFRLDVYAEDNINIDSEQAINIIGDNGINLTTFNTDIENNSSGTGSYIINTNSIERFKIDNTGAWLLATVSGTSGQVLTSGGAGVAPTWTTISSGGITNSAIANEMMKSDGVNAISSGIFSASLGNIQLGTGDAGISRVISADSSGANSSISIRSKGSGGASLSNLTGGSVSLYGTTNKFEVIGTTIHDIILNDAATSTLSSVIKFIHRTSSVPTVGIGTTIELVTEGLGSNDRIGTTISSIITDITSGSENFDLTLNTRLAGALSERLRISGNDYYLGDNSVAESNMIITARSSSSDCGIQLVAKGNSPLRFTAIQSIFTGPPTLPSYTVAGVPAAASYLGSIIFVSNESGGAIIAFSDGANWRRVTDRAIIT